MPTLSRLQNLKGGKTFQVVTISLDRTAQDAAQWLESQTIGNLTPYHDSSFDLPSQLKVPGLPLSVFYNKYGAEIARLPGEAHWDSPEALALVDKLLQE